MIIRQIQPHLDAYAITHLYQTNRDMLREHESDRDDDFFTFAAQRDRLQQRARAGIHQFLIVDGDEPAGLLSIFNVLPHGPMSCQIGYWVSEDRQGRGLATDAVGCALEYAFHVLCLHRVEAATKPDNYASQRVLRKNGFRIFGEAKSYLYLGGQWHDMVLLERVSGQAAYTPADD
jgi:ribosomal-protein-alanine N-acetyltransferase